MKTHVLSACSFALLLAVGCGPSGPELVPVTGQVTLDGQPLGLKNLYFSPVTGTAGAGAGGNSKADGTFELLAVVGGATEDMKGAPVGQYKVVVAEPMFPIEAEMAVQGEGSEPEVAIGLPQAPKRGEKLAIPPVYSNKDTTPLQVEVKPGGGELLIELSSKG
jgi:hypothetical protein